MKRQRERQKQQEQMAKDARRRERSAQKKDAKLNGTSSPMSKLQIAPLGPVRPRDLHITHLGPPPARGVPPLTLR
jgi:hypothetical protein